MTFLLMVATHFLESIAAAFAGVSWYLWHIGVTS